MNFQLQLIPFMADKQQFRDAVKPIHEAFAADVNKELLDKINEKIAEIQ